MFARFKMSLPESFNQTDEACAPNNTKIQSQIHKTLDDYISNDCIDLSVIEDDWFPHIDAQVFLSHSHRDEVQVKKLAEHLYNEYGLSCFIDSMVWGYSDDLLLHLNNKLIPENASDEEKKRMQNKNSSVVYILLQSALAKMIDHCECVVFVDTPNSIDFISESSYTNSIWIYNELLMATRMRTKPYEYYRQDVLAHGKFKYIIPVELDSFTDLTIEDLANAKETALFKDDPNNILENLYINKGLLNRGN